MPFNCLRYLFQTKLSGFPIPLYHLDHTSKLLSTFQIQATTLKPKCIFHYSRGTQKHNIYAICYILNKMLCFIIFSNTATDGMFNPGTALQKALRAHRPLLQCPAPYTPRTKAVRRRVWSGSFPHRCRDIPFPDKPGCCG